MMQTLLIGNMRGLASETAIFLHSGGAQVATSEDIMSAIHHLRKSRCFDLALIDADLDIRKFASQLEVERLSLPIVACGTESAIAERAIAHGAREFLPLPTSEKHIAEMLRLPHSTRRSSDPKNSDAIVSGDAVLEDEASGVFSELEDKGLEDKGLENKGIVFCGEAMASLLAVADKFARSRAHILITGETGSGKELLARYIHKRSPRSKHAFVAVNCAAITDSLLESELFGHEKGAFTGAIAARKGKFELSDGGTLLLDEISEMNFNLQAKLLRAIQERAIDKVGGSRPISVDLRIVCTSNRDIPTDIGEGRFREDLYYRLNVMELHIPPLRERSEDIPPLADYFTRKFTTEYGFNYYPLSQKILRKLGKHGFPGNVRELENIIHRAVILADGSAIGDNMIIFKSLPPAVS